MKRTLAPSIVVLGFTGLFAGEVWEDKPASQWSEKESIRVMERSPWTKKKVIRGHPGRALNEGPGGGDLPPNRTFYVSFSSALPFRQALARWGVLSQSLTPEQAQAFVDQEEFSEYLVVSVWGPGGQDMGELEEVTTEMLQKNTYLELKKSKIKIPLSRYSPPSETGSGEGLFYFPRTRNGAPFITLAEDEVKFESRLSKKVRLSLKFKLKKMVINGGLEI